MPNPHLFARSSLTTRLTTIDNANRSGLVLRPKRAWQRFERAGAGQGASAAAVTDAAALRRFQHRRALLKQATLGALGTWTGTSALGVAWGAAPASAASGALPPYTRSQVPGALTTETPARFAAASNYNNFYEFSTDKEAVALLAQKMPTAPWLLRIEGLVQRPLTLDMDAIRKVAPLEERIYRLRCVEGWSMVIPWIGYAFSALIARAQPLGSAKYVEMHTLADAATMPGIGSRTLAWPYVEGLRLDEAQHPLTLLALGMYGQPLPKQNGAPLRLVVPWKYGFKSIKSLVTLRFTERQPLSSWSRAAPQEYGFYANVNPTVAHPRWSQATERRIGTGDGLFAPRQRTHMFNGYDVASLYAGMDLQRFY